MKTLFKTLAFLCLGFVSTDAFAQFTISGTVSDAATSEPLFGASVFEATTETGTSTDLNGQYEFTLPAGDYTLRFSSIGYVTANIDVCLRRKRRNS